ncbi:MAG: EamA family transporter [Pontimonas sp.]
MRRSVGWVVLAASLWGTTGTAAFFLGPDVSPLAIGALTMGVGGVILALLGGRDTLALWRDRRARSLLIVGALGTVTYPLAFYSGMASAGIALGNVVALGLGPLTAALLEWGIEKTRPRPSWWLASTAAVVGIAVMAGSGVELGGGEAGNVTLGVAYATLAGVSYGAYTYVFGKLADLGHRPRAVAGGVFGAGAPALLVILAMSGAPLLASPERLGLAAYLVIGPMVIAYLAFTSALARLQASTVATIALLEPVVATVLALVVVGEILGGSAALGIVLVLVSLAVFSVTKGPQRRS